MLSARIKNEKKPLCKRRRRGERLRWCWVEEIFTFLIQCVQKLQLLVSPPRMLSPQKFVSVLFPCCWCKLNGRGLCFDSQGAASCQKCPLTHHLFGKHFLKASCSYFLVTLHPRIQPSCICHSLSLTIKKFGTFGSLGIGNAHPSPPRPAPGLACALYSINHQDRAH